MCRPRRELSNAYFLAKPVSIQPRTSPPKICKFCKTIAHSAISAKVSLQWITRLESWLPGALAPPGCSRPHACSQPHQTHAAAAARLTKPPPPLPSPSWEDPQGIFFFRWGPGCCWSSPATWPVSLQRSLQTDIGRTFQSSVNVTLESQMSALKPLMQPKAILGRDPT